MTRNKILILMSVFIFVFEQRTRKIVKTVIRIIPKMRSGSQSRADFVSVTKARWSVRRSAVRSWKDANSSPSQMESVVLCVKPSPVRMEGSVSLTRNGR